MQVAVAPRDEDIGRAIVGVRGIRFVETCRYAHHNVANTAVQCLLEESFALRKPEIANLHIQVFADKRGKLIFESLLLVIGVWKIVGVSADAQLRGRRTWKTDGRHLRARTPLIAEDIERISRLRFRFNLLHGSHYTEGGVWVVGGDGGKRGGAHPSTDSGINRDILLAVGAGKGHRIADDSGDESNCQSSCRSGRPPEPSVHRAVKYEVAGRREHAAVHGQASPRECPKLFFAEATGSQATSSP